MLIPNLDYAAAFTEYERIAVLICAPVPFWWAGGRLIRALRRDTWASPDYDLGVSADEYAVMCDHLRERGYRCIRELRGEGQSPSRIGPGASSLWESEDGTKFDIMQLPAVPGFGKTPISRWLSMMDLNVCQVLIGPGRERLCIHADGNRVLTDIAEGRVLIYAHHPSTHERAEKYKQRFAGTK